jgi:hypothetical protein
LEVKNVINKFINSYENNKIEEIKFLIFLIKEKEILQKFIYKNKIKKLLKILIEIFEKYSNKFSINNETYNILKSCIDFFLIYFEKINDIDITMIFFSCQNILNKWFYNKFNLTGRIYKLFGYFFLNYNNIDSFKDQKFKILLYFKNFLEIKMKPNLISGKNVGR